MTNKPMLSVRRELLAVIEVFISSQADAFPLISIPRGLRSDGLDQVSKELRALLDKPEIFDLEEPQVVGYMPDHPDGDPLITLEDHQNYVAALLARQAFASNAYPVGCRYRKTDRPDRCWTYCEGVKVTPWKGWEVQPLFTGQPSAQKQGEPVAWYKPHWNGLSAEFRLGAELSDDVFPDMWSKLYAEQPAPVAVAEPALT